MSFLRNVSKLSLFSKQEKNHWVRKQVYFSFPIGRLCMITLLCVYCLRCLTDIHKKNYTCLWIMSVIYLC